MNTKLLSHFKKIIDMSKSPHPLVVVPFPKLYKPLSTCNALPCFV